MKRLIIDLDGTLALPAPATAPAGPAASAASSALAASAAPADYARAVPDLALVARLRQYRLDGYQIVIHTSRNMRTYDGNVGKINVHTLPLILAWLTRHDVPFDEVLVGKPWCGLHGFYVDDRAVRPTEFARCTAAEIDALLSAERTGR